MKNIVILVSVFYALLSSLSLHAIMAYPYPVTVRQPDGSELTIMLHGDERMSVTTTVDGYAVMLDSDGFYKYAVVADGDSVAVLSVVARNELCRTASEVRFLSGVKKFDRFAARNLRASSGDAAGSCDSRAILGSGAFRGLVILVEFNDRAFSRSDISDIFGRMINERGYKGFVGSSGEWVPYTGSVRDYFYDNSMGMFDPAFDVVGPVVIDYAQTYPCSMVNGPELMAAALRAADPVVDYSLYDSDGDGAVDMVYFIFAGAGANFTGNNAQYLWPHAATIPVSVKLDGMKFGRYACSAELYGREQDGIIDGIGTICHEFSHLLGLPDLYDTDYATGGLSVTPGDWSVMASGSYHNMARTPCGYSLFERYAAGFAQPQTISGDGFYRLEPLADCNYGYRIDSAVDNEYFLVENRQQTGWDSYLPGHGMLVFRVDSTDVAVWRRNMVNASPAHNYYELLRACRATDGNGLVVDSAGDAFPGSGDVTALTNVTEVSMRSWTGLETGIVIDHIYEDADGIIEFSTILDREDADMEDFEECGVTAGDDAEISGRFCSWRLAGGARVELTSEANGAKAVAMVMGASLTALHIGRPVEFVSFYIAAPQRYPVTMMCEYSSDGGATWHRLLTLDGENQVEVSAGTSSLPLFRGSGQAGCMYRITEAIGNKQAYVDDVRFIYDKRATSSVADVEVGAGGGSFAVGCNGRSLNVVTDSHAPVAVYAVSGVMVARRVPTGGALTIELPCAGAYIVSQGSHFRKVLSF